MNIQRNVSLKTYTTFRIGGRAKYFFQARTKKDLIKIMHWVKDKKLPFFILGKGSNILVSDRGFKGLVINIKYQEAKVKKEEILTEAGASLNQLVNLAVKNNLTGLEWATGIPGTVGGAIYGNAGAFNQSIGQCVKTVEVLNAKDFKIKYFNQKNCRFSYRESIFKNKKNLIILSVALKLKRGDKKEIKNKIVRYSEYRKQNQPLNFPSAGSVFKNPDGFSAGELIEKCDLKGKRIGNVKISEKHANFIVNLGGGEAKNVKKLIKLIKEKVKEKFNIILKEEIQFLP